VERFLIAQLISHAAAVQAGSQSAGTPGNTATVTALRAFYLGMQAAVHQRAIQSYSAIAIGTRNAAIRDYACRALPVLRRHLAAVQRAIGSEQPALAMSGSTALGAKVSAACS
jgi:hypothetical protein